MEQNRYNTLIEAAWKVAEEGLNALTPERISQVTGDPLEEARRLFPEKYHVILALLRNILLHSIKQQTLIPLGEEITPEEKLFDKILCSFEVASPHKEAIRRLSQDVLWDPLTFLKITPSFQQVVNEMVEEAYSPLFQSAFLSHHLLRLALQGAYQVLLARVFYVWLEDTSIDMGSTMAALDQGIKQLTECQQWFNLRP